MPGCDMHSGPKLAFSMARSPDKPTQNKLEKYSTFFESEDLLLHFAKVAFLLQAVAGQLWVLSH